jgi:hypothetical protein
MDNQVIISGDHVLIFPSGTACTLPKAGTASRTNMPSIMTGKILNDLTGTADATSDPLWFDLGTVESFKVERSGDEKKIYKPSPGVRQLYKIKRNKSEVGLTFSISEVGPKMIEYVFGTAVLTAASTDYTILDNVSKEGWVHYEQYNDDNKLWNSGNVYCDITVKSYDSGDDAIKYDVVCTVLYAPGLNKGSLVATV